MRSANSSIQNSEIIAEYLSYLAKERRYSAHTVKAVSSDLNKLPGVLLEQTASSLKSRLAQLRSAGLSASSLARVGSSWRGFYRFAIERGILSVSPAVGLKTPKLPRRLPKALGVDQALSLVGQAESAASLPLKRGQALAALLYGTGLRIHEAIGIDWSECANSRSIGWLDLQACELSVTGKGGKRRQVPLPSVVAGLLSEWRAYAQQFIKQDGGAIFVSAKGQRIGIRQAQRDLSGLAKRKGLDVPVHPHMLRHSFGSHMLQESQNLRAVQDLLGHESISSTQIYTSLDFKHLAGVYDNAFPRAKKKS